MAALQDPETRENALLDLSKKRDMFADLAPILWHSFGAGRTGAGAVPVHPPLASHPTVSDASTGSRRSVPEANALE